MPRYNICSYFINYNLTIYSDIPFFQGLSLNSIAYAQEILQRGSQALEDSSSTISLDVPGLITQIDKLHKAMEKATLSTDTVAMIPRGWQLVQMLTNHTIFADAESILQRQMIMVTHLDMYLWLSSCVKNLELNPRKSHNSGSDEQSWIVRLLIMVDSVVKNHLTQDTIQFDSGLYLPDLRPRRVYTYRRTGSKTLAPPHCVMDDACDLAATIIRHWLQFPDDPDHAIKTRFLNLLMTKVGNSSIFLLDEIWKAYCFPKLVCKVKKNALLPTKSDWDRLQKFFTKHSFFQNVHLAQSLDNLNLARTAFLNISREPRSATSESVVPQSLSVYSPPSIPTTSTPSPAPFLRFLLDLYPLIQPDFDPTSRELSPLQQKVCTNLDYFLPFRELGPSRQRIHHSPDGPFSRQHNDRRGVLFSALIFRGITFATDALKTIEHSGFFSNLAEWNLFHGSYVPPGITREAFFCNPGPFGRTNNRTTSNAAQFWTASEVLLNFLEKPDLKRYPQGPKFLDVVKHIVNANYREPNQRKKKTYPTFGRLVAYLVAVDLAYVGLIPTPTIDEMAEVIEYINLGAVGGLRTFKLFQGNDDKPEGAGQVFKMVFSYLDSALTDTQKEAMRFDIFMVEHGLCKGKRMDKWLYN